MAFCLLCSTLHYWFYQSRTNCRDLNPSDIATIPIPKTVAEYPGEFKKLADNISEKIDETCVKRIGNYAGTGTVEFETFQPKSAKEYFDQIDLNLARHYGFDDEQTDFIINYDIKYRMGGMDDEE